MNDVASEGCYLAADSFPYDEAWERGFINRIRRGGTLIVAEINRKIVWVANISIGGWSKMMRVGELGISIVKDREMVWELP